MNAVKPFHSHSSRVSDPAAIDCANTSTLPSLAFTYNTAASANVTRLRDVDFAFLERVIPNDDGAETDANYTKHQVIQSLLEFAAGDFNRDGSRVWPLWLREPFAKAKEAQKKSAARWVKGTGSLDTAVRNRERVRAARERALRAWVGARRFSDRLTLALRTWELALQTLPKDRTMRLDELARAIWQKSRFHTREGQKAIWSERTRLIGTSGKSTKGHKIRWKLDTIQVRDDTGIVGGSGDTEDGFEQRVTATYEQASEFEDSGDSQTALIIEACKYAVKAKPSKYRDTTKTDTSRTTRRQTEAYAQAKSKVRDLERALEFATSATEREDLSARLKSWRDELATCGSILREVANRRARARSAKVLRLTKALNDAVMNYGEGSDEVRDAARALEVTKRNADLRQAVLSGDGGGADVIAFEALVENFTVETDDRTPGEWWDLPYDHPPTWEFERARAQRAKAEKVAAAKVRKHGASVCDLPSRHEFECARAEREISTPTPPLELLALRIVPDLRSRFEEQSAFAKLPIAERVRQWDRTWSRQSVLLSRTIVLRPKKDFIGPLDPRKDALRAKFKRLRSERIVDRIILNATWSEAADVSLPVPTVPMRKYRHRIPTEWARPRPFVAVSNGIFEAMRLAALNPMGLVYSVGLAGKVEKLEVALRTREGKLRACKRKDGEFRSRWDLFFGGEIFGTKETRFNQLRKIAALRAATLINDHPPRWEFKRARAEREIIALGGESRPRDLPYDHPPTWEFERARAEPEIVALLLGNLPPPRKDTTCSFATPDQVKARYQEASECIETFVEVKSSVVLRHFNRERNSTRNLNLWKDTAKMLRRVRLIASLRIVGYRRAG